MAASSPRKTKKRFSVKTYKDEAGVEPYEFECGDGTVLELFGPDVDGLRAMQAQMQELRGKDESELTSEDMDLVLRTLLGEHFDRVMGELGPLPARALNDFAEELQGALLGKGDDLGDSSAPQS